MKSLLLYSILLLPLPSFAGVLVGYSDKSITPTREDASQSCLGGYTPYTRCGITEIDSDISVRSLAMSSIDQNLIISVIDTVGIGDSIISMIKDEVHSRSFGLIDQDEIFLTATHTHHGPDLQGLWGGVSTPYLERIVDEAAISILSAYFRKSPATISLWKTEADIENRRGWPEVDQSMTVVMFKHKKTSEKIASLVNMSAHPTLVPKEVRAYSSDYVGSLRDTLERGLQSDVIFVNGIVGDAQPHVEAPLSLRTAEQFGSDMGERALALAASAVQIKGDLRVKTSVFTHPVSNPGLISATLSGFLDLDLNPDNSVTRKIAVFEIGKSLSGLTFPGEALTRVGIPLRNELPGQHRLFFGLSGGSLGYFVPSDEFLIFPARKTEEQASLHPLIGDNISIAIKELIAAAYPEPNPFWLIEILKKLKLRDATSNHCKQ